MNVAKSLEYLLYMKHLLEYLLFYIEHAREQVNDSVLSHVDII